MFLNWQTHLVAAVLFKVTFMGLLHCEKGSNKFPCNVHRFHFVNKCFPSNVHACTVLFKVNCL